MTTRHGPSWISAIIQTLLLFLALILLFNALASQDIDPTKKNISYETLKFHIENGNVQSLKIYTSGMIEGTYKKPDGVVTNFEVKVMNNLNMDWADKIRSEIKEKNPSATVEPLVYSLSPLAQFLTVWGPTLILIAFFIFIFRKMGKNGINGGFTNFTRSKARLASDISKKTFEDVAGVHEAKEELKEIVDFLKNPSKFLKLGGKIPKGVLLVGPPGTGKTLLAKAVAGEANVKFFSLSGADFVELFVGVGAARVRDLFEQGKKNAPCILFVDELDAVGRHRGAGLGGGHDEREQTLNQLLVEMDGFEASEGVILMAATNRLDVLDPALLRPGRFDRKIVVGRPDLNGRTDILGIHVKKVPLDQNVDLKVIARGTPGFTGADLANLVNEAAINAGRYNRQSVTMEDFEFSKDKVIMGTERRSMYISPEERKITAYHEAGHAIVAALVKSADPVHKLTIIPRGMALGATLQLPEEDRHNYSKEFLTSSLVILMGGRCAEEIYFGKENITSGASNDIDRATEIARSMVCEYGMSDLGPRKFGNRERDPFLGRQLSEQDKDYSEYTSRRIDNQMSDMLSKAYSKAYGLISERADILDKIANELLDKETISGDDVKRIMLQKES